MIALAVLFLGFCGFSVLALSLTRHQQEVLGLRVSPGRATRLRAGGAAALAMGLGLSLNAWGFGYGLVMALGLASIAAALVVGALSILRWRDGKR
ncbi:MAG: DUF3325 domain-containing protein [Caulobacter sp.]